MTRRLLFFPLASAVLLAPGSTSAEEKVDWAAVGRIRDDGFRRSQVMETAAQLTDVHGPRLTGSPGYKAAAEWARGQLESWGLANAHLEAFPFGRGWSLEHCSAHVVSPMAFPLIALPQAWTAGTDGPVRGKVVRVEVTSEDDLAKWRGKLRGMVVWAGEPRELKAPEDGALFERYTDADLAKIEQYEMPGHRGPFNREEYLKRRRLRRALEKLYTEEKILAAFEPSSRDADVLLLGGGGSRKVGDPQAPPQLVVAADQWNRVARLLDRKMEIEVELNVRSTFYEDDPSGYNVVAELPGTDGKGEVVMVGAHLDSWHPGTGATDNAAGCAVTMEAMRILKAVEVRPRRTIRIGLWGGEEEGLLGSRAYVDQHLASRPPRETGPDEVPSWLRNEPPPPMTVKPEHSKLSVYLNYDNGTGKIRGVYLQENSAARPVFEGWLPAVEDLGVTALTLRNTGGTDHLSFDSVGIPGFQFVQDPIEYSSGTFFGTHHTNMDVYDRLQSDDLKQAAVVIAIFAYQAAMRDLMFPRKAPPPSVPASPARGGAQPAAKASSRE
jgi:carboxypeptidase Q